MIPGPITDLMAFVPAKDPEVSKRFYLEQQKLAEKYPGIICKPPAMQPWGIRVLYLSDPTGVLWHITDNRKS